MAGKQSDVSVVVFLLSFNDGSFVFGQDSAILPAVMELEESEMSRELREKARVSVERFLQVGKRKASTTSAERLYNNNTCLFPSVVLFPGTGG